MHTLGVCHLGGATMDIEENYLIRKLFAGGWNELHQQPGANMTQLHGTRSGTSFGRGGATTAQQDLSNADAI